MTIAEWLYKCYSVSGMGLLVSISAPHFFRHCQWLSLLAPITDYKFLVPSYVERDSGCMKQQCVGFYSKFPCKTSTVHYMLFHNFIC
jgi:hypothetical protein